MVSRSDVVLDCIWHQKHFILFLVTVERKEKFSTRINTIKYHTLTGALNLCTGLFLKCLHLFFK